MKAVRQKPLFPDLMPHRAVKPVNVASVPQRSPFRYPGGKTWFVPIFRSWCSSLKVKPEILIEPFAGGGIISITALFESMAPLVVMVEIDDDVASVWKTVVDGHSDWLAKKIINFNMTKDAVIKELSKTDVDTKGKAFQTILKNRTFHGGILADGSTFLKYGENGKGILSRWYPMTIARRFNNLKYVAGRIIFRQEDGLAVIKEYSQQEDAIFFIDPPYTAGKKKAGKRLYRHFNIDHEYLFELCKTIKGDFLMTYDNADEVRAMARKHDFHMRLVPMKSTHHTKMEELVIGKNLSWMDTYPSP